MSVAAKWVVAAPIFHKPLTIILDKWPDLISLISEKSLHNTFAIKTLSELFLDKSPRLLLWCLDSDLTLLSLSSLSLSHDLKCNKDLRSKI